MRLTHATDLGLRVLMVLSLHKAQRLTVPQMAAMLDVSENHLVKVCIKLSSIGYIRSLRGRGGGVELALLPENIRVGDAVRSLEEDFELVECMRGETGDCILTPACELKSLLEDANSAFFQTLNNKTLADLVARRRRFTSIVSIAENSPARKKAAQARS